MTFIVLSVTVVSNIICLIHSPYLAAQNPIMLVLWNNLYQIYMHDNIPLLCHNLNVKFYWLKSNKQSSNTQNLSVIPILMLLHIWPMINKQNSNTQNISNTNVNVSSHMAND